MRFIVLRCDGALVTYLYFTECFAHIEAYSQSINVHI